MSSECLHGQDRSHGEERSVGAKQDGKDHPAAKVTAGSGRRNSEIDHLGGKDKCRQNSHQRNFAFIEILFTLREEYPIAAAVAAHIVPPTAGESSASAMCMENIL